MRMAWRMETRCRGPRSALSTRTAVTGPPSFICTAIPTYEPNDLAYRERESNPHWPPFEGDASAIGLPRRVKICIFQRTTSMSEHEKGHEKAARCRPGRLA